MNTRIFKCNESYYVEISLDGELHDECGPFDCRDDAEWCAERAERIAQ